MTKVTIPVNLIASKAIFGTYWLTTKLTINPNGTTVNLSPIKLISGLSDSPNRYIQKTGCEITGKKEKGSKLLIKSTGIFCIISQLTTNPQINVKPMTKL
jgi:hypothetical protein